MLRDIYQLFRKNKTKTEPKNTNYSNNYVDIDQIQKEFPQYITNWITTEEEIKEHSKLLMMLEEMKKNQERVTNEIKHLTQRLNEFETRKNESDEKKLVTKKIKNFENYLIRRNK